MTKIVPAIAAADRVQIYGVCSRNAENVARTASTWGCRGWTEADEMLSDRAVDVVYVATPIGLHAEHGKRVLASGKHLWCEKPLAATAAAALDLLEISRRRRLAVCEGHMYLYHPQFRRLKDYLSDGRIGRIRSITCRFGIPHMADPGFRTDATLGGGALLDVGCYPVSAIHALFPRDRHDVRYSVVSLRDGSGVDTDGYAVLQLSSGGVAMLEWRTDTAYRNEIDIWGTEASLFTDKIFSKLPTYAPVFRFRDNHGVETTEQTETADHFVRMLEAFAELVEDESALESERRSIARRAETIEEIQARALSVPVARSADVVSTSS
jgi:predicted dehydrogenase